MNEAAGHPGPFPLLETSDEAFLFSNMGQFCSICAPLSWTSKQVETFARKENPRSVGRWRAVDKSKFGGGEPTPNPCPHAPERRRHWFLMLLKAPKH